MRGSTPWLVALAVLGLAGCGGPAKTPVGPTANFTEAPICDLVPALHLVSTSKAGDAKIVMSTWTFSDGTSARGQAVSHRWAANGTATVDVGTSLTVTDANGLGDQKSKNVSQAPCLAVTGAHVDTAGTNLVTPHVEIENDSTFGNALVAFTLEIDSADGLPLAVGINGGQVQIDEGKTVDVFSTSPVTCGSDCAAFAAGTVVPHVATTYWCDASICK